MMNGLRRPRRLDVWSLIAATVGWTMIATRTPRFTMIASAMPLGATTPPKIGTGCRANLVAEHRRDRRSATAAG